MKYRLNYFFLFKTGLIRADFNWWRAIALGRRILEVQHKPQN